MDKVKVVIFCNAWNSDMITRLEKTLKKEMEKLVLLQDVINVQCVGEYLDEAKQKMFIDLCADAEIVILDAWNHKTGSSIEGFDSMKDIAKQILRRNPAVKLFAQYMEINTLVAVHDYAQPIPYWADKSLSPVLRQAIFCKQESLPQKIGDTAFIEGGQKKEETKEQCNQSEQFNISDKPSNTSERSLLMKVLVIDDTKICLERTTEVLEKEGWNVETVHITSENRENFRITELDQHLPIELDGVDIVVSDLEFGGNVNSFGLVCAIRRQHPQLPVVLFTGAYIKEAKELSSVGIYYFDKGRWFNREIYPKAGNRILEDLNEGYDKNYSEIPQNNPIIPSDDPAWTRNGIPKTDPRLQAKLPPLWSDIKATGVENISSVFDSLKSWVKRSDEDSRKWRLSQLKIIMGLQDQEAVEGMNSDGRNEWFTISRPGPLTHEIGHALCDGKLSPEDVKPFLPGLKKILAKISDHVSTDNRFRPCADFINSNRQAEDLPMIQGTY